ncbi:guanine nucleotide-binding protein g(o) subunit alpha [Anaeramoeba flamelloides]|uniref:Guanine nucleotide-binding protein g(O) subunit alpha n=1 Tax=Anaeramoeba flamelloides TaxID=1746091 RepID=A0AAV7Z7Z1_9EUKA|nr:guanine nucleotide-binding protein g(o) subunit alpha [Anaeramoeba flamelloides]KAJ6252158.1 guanine nucleotide-binding protein g(o) subunit alpha [Anaeramoeba flamelloides]
MCGCISDKESNFESKNNKKIEMKARKIQRVQSSIFRLLIVGAGQSGKSTIVKQCKNLYTKGWSKKEFIKNRTPICSNVIESIQTLIEIKDKLGYEFSNSKNTKHSKEIQELGNYSKITEKIALKIKTLWNDPAIQKAYQKRNKFQLVDSAEYFLNKVEDISKEDYIPTVEDTLNLRITTTGINETSFTYSDQKYCLIDVGGQRNERKKWLHCFENVTSIIYVASLSAYDQVLAEEITVNRMAESLMLFSDIINSRWFNKIPAILFLNKYDLFEKKLKHSKLKKTFPDYDGGKDVDEGKVYIKNQFLSKNKENTKEIYTHYTTAIDPDNFQKVFESVNEILLKKSIKSIGWV